MFRVILIASLVVAGLTAASRAAMVGLGNNDCGTWTSNNPAAAWACSISNGSSGFCQAPATPIQTMTR
jgi:hypothetical protein